MIELIGGGVAGSIIGGLLRLAPEVLKWLDKKGERAHELAMFSRQCELEQLRGQLRLAEIGAHHEMAIDVGALDAFKSAVEQQTEMTKAAGGWVAKLSASVRPVITYWVLTVWTFIHGWYAYRGWQSGLDATDVFRLMMSADFSALVAGTINYWFLDRTLHKRGLA